ncbi:uncharacterized protein LOC118415300 isoform X2 [Branchiostoma floridae]|uniref:Uncharacterized protein LOC118415300 isoform X2 n=1 Tax=Branchiostoma floridae TaxID=7739 RepID=A0A9J7MPG2_BRAFL|nr:uncharacterized protein LOC118415300 isoform X2 [Branchiostoma floridae]
MNDLKTATTALKAVVELGYPLELSRVLDYLENLDSKDELIQFDNEEALCSFLQKHPAIFWVEGGKVFPAQMKPKVKSKSSPQTQSPQSHHKVQPTSDSSEKVRQQEQRVGEVEEAEGGKEKNKSLDAADNVHQTAKLREDGIKSIAEVLKREGPKKLKALFRYVQGLRPEVRSFVGKDEESVTEFLVENPDTFLIDDDDVVFHISTVQQEAMQQFKSVLQSKGKLPVSNLSGHISGFKHKYEILWFVGGSPSDVETFLKGYPNTFRVEDSGTVSLIKTKTKQAASALACSGGKTKTTNVTTEVAVEVPRKKSEQPKMNKDKELLQEGVEHFKGVLQVKGSMPMERLFGHINQCRKEVKRAVGTKEDEVKKLLKSHPDVFSVSKKGNVQLQQISCKAKQKQADQGKEKLVATNSTSNSKEQEKTDQIASTGSAPDLSQEGNEVATNDKDTFLLQDFSSNSCHHLFDPSASDDINMKQTVDQINAVENHQDPDEEEEQVDVERETSELIFDLIQRCGEISFSALQGYINLLGEDKQECIKHRGGLLSFLHHHHGQTFRIDQVSVTQEETQARTTSAPVHRRPLHLLVGEDGTRVWVNSGEQDMQHLSTNVPMESVVPGANPTGQPDDFTSLLPMFKDNLSPIQDNLVEVEIDIGRIPVASTLKNSSGEVVGLTLRRGQAVPGCLDLLWDVVTSGTSTLIMGCPCSGRTTLLREWARVLSDVCYRRVIVVDTLKEIAGGDDIPHPGIGGARRVQVHNRCDQVSQLQTAARNHSPDCIIVDEVQTQEEVTALQAIRLTGIQVVAGVCAGCLTDLLQNSVMRGLLGLSDTASTFPQTPSTSESVPPTFPQTLPVFQAAVVIHSRDMVSVYSDVASFVRVSLLEGRLFPLAQQRKRVVTRDRETEL